ncbi:AAA family ATPase [Micromonospora sp. NPDC002296]|uniref:AAA family ATPase n=1 Tax=Micromonospora sp. NPDC002296 TaxID=3154271 RepID=UPI0033334A31
MGIVNVSVPTGLQLFRVQFAHRGPNGIAPVDLQDQSTGSRQLLTLGLRAAAMLRTGATMLIDEIDASLHPIATAKLIVLFRSPAANPPTAALVEQARHACVGAHPRTNLAA